VIHLTLIFLTVNYFFLLIVAPFYTIYIIVNTLLALIKSKPNAKIIESIISFIISLIILFFVFGAAMVGNANSHGGVLISTPNTETFIIALFLVVTIVTGIIFLTNIILSSIEKTKRQNIKL